MSGGLLVQKEALEAFAARLLAAGGLDAAEAASVAEVLVWADLRGTDSHGVVRLPMYLELLASGQMRGDAQLQRVLHLPALSILEGARCAGAVGMRAAAAEAMASARQAGMGMCLLRDTTHTGALGFYTENIARSGMLALAGAASGPNMAYHQAAAAGVSTAPLSIAAPGADGDPMLFDMASGVVALGKLQQAKAAGQAIPAGWALNAQGHPTTDPAAAKIPLPLGGPKGSGLALMMEALTSLLVNNPILAPALSATATATTSATAAPQRHYQNGFVIAIDLAQIPQAGDYLQQIGELAAAIKGLPAMPQQELLLPGERGARQARASRSAGIALRPGTLAALDRAAAALNVTRPW
nr:Ldh family oxidoreductase [uncultured Roseateles sp.]